MRFPSSAPLARLDLIIAALLSLLAALFYLSAASPWLQGGDSAEFVYVASGQGLAHPPGYPLYSLLLRALSPVLGGATPAQAAARVTALCAALALSAVFVAIRAHGGARLMALAGTLWLATHPLFVTYATRAEVFALHLALVAGLVALCGERWLLSPRRRAVALATVAGLGLAHHHTIVLLAPLGLVAWWRALWDARVSSQRGWAFGAGRWASRWRSTLALSAVAVALPLSLYLTLLAASDIDSLSTFRAPSTMLDLWNYFTRAGYGTFRLSASRGAAAGPLVELGSLAQTLCASGGALWLVAAFGGAVFGGVARLGKVSVYDWRSVGVWLCFAASGPLFIGMFAAPPTDAGRLVAERFHLMPLALLAILGALGASARSSRTQRLGAAVLAACVSASLFVHAPLPQSDETERLVRQALQDAAPNAILVSAEDSFLFVARELKREGVRPDVATIAATATRSRELRQVYQRELHLSQEPTDAKSYILSLLATGRPVYATSRFSEEMFAALHPEPVGTLWLLQAPKL